MRIKKIISLFATSMCVAGLVACSQNSSISGTANVETTQMAASETKEEINRSEKLIIYSNSASDGRGEWLTEKAKEAGFNIEMVDIGGAELTDRVIAEKNNGIADIVYGINAVDSNKLKSEDILIQYSPSWFDKIDASLADKDGYFNPVFVQPLILVGNEGDEMPEDWTELSAKYPNEYAIYGLNGGTSRMILSSILVRYLYDNGEMGVSDEGWAVVKDYVQNAYMIKKGEKSVIKVLDENDPIKYGMIWGSGALQAQQEFGKKFAVMNPEMGVPFVTEQTMILKSSKKQELAKEFIDWFGNADIMAEYNAKFGSIPANKEAEIAEDGKELLNSVNPQEIDWEVVGNYLDQWVEKVELEFVK